MGLAGPPFDRVAPFCNWQPISTIQWRDWKDEGEEDEEEARISGATDQLYSEEPIAARCHRVWLDIALDRTMTAVAIENYAQQNFGGSAMMTNAAVVNDTGDQWHEQELVDAMGQVTAAIRDDFALLANIVRAAELCGL